MKKIKPTILLILVSAMGTLMLGCSDDDNEKSKSKSSGDHVWKQQTDALKSAKDVAGKLQQSLDQQKEKMDESN